MNIMNKAAFFCLLMLTISACSDNEEQQQTNKSAEYLARAESYFNQGQYKVAIIEIKNSLQADNNNIEAYNLLASTYFEQGKHRQSIALLNTLPEKNSESTLLLAKNYIILGKAKSTLETLQAAFDKGQLNDNFEAKLIEVKALVILNEISASQKRMKTLHSLAQTSEQQSDAALAQAMIYAKSNKRTQQLTELEKALKLNENNIEALLMLARYKFNNDDLEAAEDYLSQALFTLPSTDSMTLQRLQVLRAMVATLSKQGRSSEAMIYSKLIAEANPRAQELEAEFQEAVDAIKAGDITTASTILENLYSSNPNQTMGAMLGMIKYSKGDFRAASELFGNSIDPETASDQALLAYAATELQMRNPEQAIQAIESNIREKADSPKLLSLYGLALLFNGDTQKAIEVMKAALDLAPDMSKTRLALADALNRTGDKQEALKELEQAFQYAPDDITIQARLLSHYEALKETAKINSLVDKLSTSKNPQSRALAGLTLLNSEPDRARQIIDDAYSALPTNNYTINAKLIESIKRNSPADIIRYSNELLEQEPNHIFALSSAASVKAKTGGDSGALSYLTEKAEESVNSWAPDYLMSRHYARNFNFDKAIVHGEAALTRSTFNQTISRYMVELYKSAATDRLRSGKPGDAKKLLMDALQVSPADASVFHLLVGVELTEDNLTQAKKIAAQADSESQDPYVSHLISGDIKKHENLIEEAILHYLDAWRMRPSDQLAKLIWSNLSDETSVKRMEFLDEWEKQIPGSYEASTLRAIRYQQTNQNDRALAQYKKSLELNPNQPIALNNLAWLLYENSKMNEAMFYAEKAKSLTPENPAILDTYALVAHKSGKLDEAKAAISKAHQLAPDNADIQKHYDDILGR